MRFFRNAFKRNIRERRIGLVHFNSVFGKEMPWKGRIVERLKPVLCDARSLGVVWGKLLVKIAEQPPVFGYVFRQHECCC